MGKTVARALLVSVFVPALSLAETTRVGVIAVGADPVAAGELQQRLDRAVASRKDLVTVPRAEIALRLGAATSSARDAGRLAALFAQAKEAYFDERLVEAGERVEEAARVVDSGLAVPGSDRVTVLTWRTALALAMQKEGEAETHAKELLALSPDAEPDLDIFRPSVGKFVDEMRPKVPPGINVKVEGAPGGSRLEVDGRLVDTQFRIGPGKHTLAMRAVGFRPAAYPFDAKSNHVVTLTPALDPGDKALGSLQTEVWGSGAAPALAGLGARLGVDAVAVVAARADGALRAMVFRRGEALRRSGSAAPGKEPESAIASWLAAALTPAASKPPKGTPAAPIASAARSWTLDAGIAVSQRDRALDGSGGAGFDTAFTGVGGFFDGELWHRSFMGGLRGSWTSYDVSTARFDLPDGTESSVLGGRTARADFRAGARVLGTPEGFGLIAQIEAVYEIHNAQDLRDDNGELGFFASYDRVAAGAGVRAHAAIGAVRLSTGVSAHPFHQWTESPAKTGRSPKGQIALGFSARAGIPVSGAWELQGEFLGERRSVTFEAGADAPVDPAIQDATISEQVHSLSLTLRRRF